MKTVAKALLIDSNDRMLLLYRGMTHPNFPGHLDLPGGEIEKNEQCVDAVAREIAEETMIRVTPNDLEKIFEKIHPDVVHVLYISHLDIVEPKITLSWEHGSYEWLTKHDIIHIPLPPNVDRYYADVIDYLKTTI